MERRPEFTVIAGANGAGKSRLSPFYVHCKSFDGDLLALKLRKEHPDWIERWISVRWQANCRNKRQKQSHNTKISLLKPTFPTT